MKSFHALRMDFKCGVEATRRGLQARGGVATLAASSSVSSVCMQPPATRLPTLFIPHGGGPCFFMEPPPSAPQLWDRLAAYLRGIDASLGRRPRAVLVISGHWEAARPTLNTAAQPPLLFDYHEFPEHTYHLHYPAPGSPVLASRVRELLDSAAIESDSDDARGLDHGVFVPFLLVYPQADVPIVQLSLQAGLDPAAHLAIGRALAPLRDEGVLIVGSGMSYHNCANSSPAAVRRCRRRSVSTLR